MHDHTKQQLEALINDFNELIKKHAPNSYPHLIDSDDNDGERLRNKIKQALKSQAEMIRAEMDSTIGSLNGLGGCECCISKVNKQKANIDELINSFE